jgi:hypothetical protein
MKNGALRRFFWMRWTPQPNVPGATRVLIESKRIQRPPSPEQRGITGQATCAPVAALFGWVVAGQGTGRHVMSRGGSTRAGLR